jgi:hypothetical protein
VSRPGGAAPSAAGEGEGAASTTSVAHPVSRGRRIGVRVLIWGTTVLAVLGMFAIWANRQLLNPDNWSDTSTKLLKNAAIRDATANYLVDQLYANVNVEEELKARLPKDVQALAGPVAGGLRSLATESAKRLLANPRVQELWRRTNRAADQALVAVVEGKEGTVAFNNGEVTLDLSTVVKEVGKRLGLPDVSAKLPPSAAHLKVMKSDQIGFVQDAGQALKDLALVFTILVPLLYALAIVLARGFRRRTLMSVGIAAVIAGIAVLVGRGLIISQVTNSLVKTESVRPAAHAVLSIATLRLSEIAGAFIVVGVPLIAAAWFAGPARFAVSGRRSIAPFLREHADWAYGITAAVMALIFIWNPIPATGKPAGIIVFLALAFLGTYLLRRQTAAEFPAAAAPELPPSSRGRPDAPAPAG